MSKLAKFLPLTLLILFYNTNLLAKEDVFPDLSLIKNEKYTYNSETLNNLFSYSAVKYAKADLAIIKAIEETTNLIQGSINLDKALNLIDNNELFLVTLTGEQINYISKMIKEGNLTKKVFLFGINNNNIAYQKIDARASYKVVISEPALKEIFGLSKYGSLDQQVALRANFIEGVYGKITNLYFIGGQKNIKLAFEKNLDILSVGTWKDILSSMSISSDEVKNALVEKQVGSKHKLMFDISYLDLGFSHNTGNEAYEAHQKNGEFPISRGDVPLIGQLFINSNIGLKYYIEKYSVSLENQLIYFQGNLKEKPQKDKFISSLNTKWQLNNLYSVIFNNSYETKLASLLFKDPKMYKKMSVFDHMIGLGFLAPMVGMDFEVGAILVNDLLTNNWRGALDVGPAINMNCKWTLFGPVELSTKIKSYYLFAMPQNMVKNKMALGIEGTAWLRVAYYKGLGVSLMSDFLIATLQDSNKLAASSIFGITLSYGNLFRLFG